jgi:hypothetical protein
MVSTLNFFVFDGLGARVLRNSEYVDQVLSARRELLPLLVYFLDFAPEILVTDASLGFFYDRIQTRRVFSVVGTPGLLFLKPTNFLINITPIITPSPTLTPRDPRVQFTTPLPLRAPRDVAELNLFLLLDVAADLVNPLIDEFAQL